MILTLPYQDIYYKKEYFVHINYLLKLFYFIFLGVFFPILLNLYIHINM